jgi:hypothetical protein
MVTAQLGQNDSLATLSQQPGMAWVNQLTSNPAFANSVEWQRVQEEHKKWAYSQTGMGSVAAAVVSLVAAPVAAQAGAAAGNAAAVAAGEGVALSGGGAAFLTGVSISAGVSSAVQAGITALASRAAASFVNNHGDLGAVLKEMGSSESVKNIATAMVTAGALQGLSSSGLLPDNLANATNGAAPFTDQLQRQLIDGAARSLVRSAINGTRLEEELRQGLTNALLNTVGAQGAFAIGDMRLDSFTSNVAHAIAGCAVGAGRASAGGGHAGQGCSAGAVGAVVGNLAAEFYDPNRLLDSASVSGFSRTMAGIAGLLVGGDVSSAYIGAYAGGNAVENNRQLHPEERTLAHRLSQQSGGRYTAQQIEEQMRLMGNKNRGVSANTLEHWDVATQPGYNADPGIAHAGRARDDASHRTGRAAGLGNPAIHRLEHDHRWRHQWRSAMDTLYNE